MTRAFKTLLCATLLAGPALGQSAETPPRFEIADVHGSAKTRNPYLRGPLLRSGRYQLQTATMLDLIKVAWGINENNVLGGPKWLEIPRYDVIAKAPPGATRDDLKPLLQTLLAERFKLVVHKDTKPVPAFILTAGKHPGLKQSDGTGPSECKFIPPGPGPRPGPPSFSYACRNMTMAAFAAGLGNMAVVPQYLNGLPVVDQTELKGAWDFAFHYSFRGGPPGSAGETITIFDAIDKQLGLKLDLAKITMPVIVVDSVNEKPTDNLPGVTEALHVPPPPTEFEVADVKPSDPATRGLNFRFQMGGRVNITGATLKFLIEQAWNINDEMLVGAPKWLDTERFDIIAKAAAADGASAAEVDFDSVWPMMRTLLADRFKLAVHNEDRPVQAYNLVAVKPKLTKADPASRTKYHEGPAVEAKDPRSTIPTRSRLITCQNMSMAEFAERLPEIASGYIHSPVQDHTGLEGGWDFSLNFSPAGMAQALAAAGGNGPGRGGENNPQPTGQPGAMPQAPDPNGAITLFEAVEKQLGLKLEAQKRTVSVLVIDHIEPKPTDN